MDLHELPPYVIINDAKQTQEQKLILKNQTQTIQFPLSIADQKDLSILEQKFDSEKNIAGLAANQIGINKRAMIFALPEEIKKKRENCTQFMEKTLWLNPVYQGIPEEGYIEDYEACFSVKNLAGIVKRFKKITYTAYLADGQKVSGTAEGFLARIIQHEIDHLNGKLFIDIAIKDSVMPMEKYREKFHKK